MTRSSIVALVGGLVLLGACAAQPGAPTATPTTQPTSPPTATVGGLQITTASSSFGQHLAGAGGRALYVLTRDSANTSTCVNDCAANWPPLLVSAGQAAAAGAGVTAQLGTLTRADGGTQVTAGGMPLYYFGGDAAATDVNGQGISGVWFLAAPDGTALGGEAVTSPLPCACTPTPPPSMPDSTDDGYGNYGDEY